MPIAVNGLKQCSRCGEIKPATPENFLKNSRTADQLRSNCRECGKISDKKRYLADPVKMKLQAKTRRANDPEKYREISKNSRTKHRDKRNAEQNAKYHEDPIPFRARAKAYREANQPQVTATVRKWRAELKREMHEAYGNKCSCCNETETKFLTLEHIGQTGSAHRKKLGGQMQVYTELRRLGWPKDGYTLLCMNCNFATRDGSICPHKIQLSPPLALAA